MGAKRFIAAVLISFMLVFTWNLVKIVEFGDEFLFVHTPDVCPGVTESEFSTFIVSQGVFDISVVSRESLYYPVPMGKFCFKASLLDKGSYYTVAVTFSITSFKVAFRSLVKGFYVENLGVEVSADGKVIYSASDNGVYFPPLKTFYIPVKIPLNASRITLRLLLHEPHIVYDSVLWDEHAIMPSVVIDVSIIFERAAPGSRVWLSRTVVVMHPREVLVIKGEPLIYVNNTATSSNVNEVLKKKGVAISVEIGNNYIIMSIGRISLAYILDNAILTLFLTPVIYVLLSIILPRGGSKEKILIGSQREYRERVPPKF